MIRRGLTHELTYAGFFGATALLLPMLFHLIGLTGRVFLPMYLPLVALAFLVRPALAVTTALIVPVVSSLTTGMPPIYPPILLLMVAELGLVTALISFWSRSGGSPLLIVMVSLVLGRLLYAGLLAVLASSLGFPPALAAPVTVLAGWPGLILMLIVIPAFIHRVRKAHAQAQT